MLIGMRDRSKIIYIKDYLGVQGGPKNGATDS